MEQEVNRNVEVNETNQPSNYAKLDYDNMIYEIPFAGKFGNLNFSGNIKVDKSARFSFTWYFPPVVSNVKELEDIYSALYKDVTTMLNIKIPTKPEENEDVKTEVIEEKEAVNPSDSLVVEEKNKE